MEIHKQASLHIQRNQNDAPMIGFPYDILDHFPYYILANLIVIAGIERDGIDLLGA